MYYRNNSFKVHVSLSLYACLIHKAFYFFIFWFIKKICFFCRNNLNIMKHFLISSLLFLSISFIYCIDSHAFLNRDVHLLTMQDGLGDNKVNCIYKDKNGFMWFGTDNGLSCYDGSSVKNFTMQLTSYMNVSAIGELSEHCLGVVVDQTLYAFDRSTERFISIEGGLEKGKLLQFIPAYPNQCRIISSTHLYLYNVKERTDKARHVTALELTMEEKVGGLVKDRDGITRCTLSEDSTKVYLTNSRLELIVYDLKSKTVTQQISLGSPKVLSISSILEAGNRIWIATIDHGIICYHKHSGHVEHISYEAKDEKNLLSHPDVYEIVQLNNNRLLAVTWNGYTLLDPGKGISEELTTHIYNNVSLVNQNLETRMICAFYDSQGVLWIGTNGGGVIYSDLRLQYFNQYHQDRHNEICSIQVDDDGYVWLATFHKGIMKSTHPFHSSSSFKFVTAGSEEVRKKETVLCTMKDAEGNIWFGNKDGTLTVYDKHGTFKVHPLDMEVTINRSSIWALHIDRQNNFWIGTDKGLLLFNSSSGKCQHIEVRKQSQPGTLTELEIPVHAITETKDGTVWVGTEQHGVGKIVDHVAGKKTMEMEYGTSFKLHNASVKSLLASSDGQLYVGYETGFAIINPENGTIHNFYTTKNGLCNNHTGCITEDAKGDIWIGSNSGISRYSRHQQLFYHYYISGSNRSAFLYGKYLFWGNNKSLTYFDPDNINVFSFSETAAITTLEVSNKTVAMGEKINGQVILNNSLFYAKEIELNHDNRDFSLTFSSLSFSKERQKLRYRLYPYQKEWMIANGGGKVSYANLRKGDYTFEIQSLYPNEHIGKMTSLKVTILPHWSETFLFKLILLVLISLAILRIIYRIRVRQKRLEYELQLQHEVFTATVARDKEKQIRMERENFFTNAAHELRTPLTLILSPLQELLQNLKSSDAMFEKLQIMYRNGSSLHTLVDHLLYVQKIEAGMVKLSLSKANIVELASREANSFCQLAEAEESNYTIDLPSEPVCLWIDIEKITSAIRNLLSNAFKYTPPKGNITLRIDQTKVDGKLYCRIIVSDSGKGIPYELQERIFDSFITGENTPLLSSKVGIGLRIVKNTMDLHHGTVTLTSTPGKGSKFTLLIPEGNTHFAEDKYQLVNPPTVEEPLISLPAAPLVVQEEKNIKKRNLLVVEDNKEIRTYICSLFRKDYAVYEAADGEEGIQVATRLLPDLIITDIMMPVKDGFTCCREIREQPCTAHIPLLMLTAKAEDADILQGTKMGADDYMMKPFNPEILKSKVENLILQRERLKRIYTKTLMLKQKQAEEAGEEEKPDDFMQQVINVIEVNLSNEDFNVKILADRLNMSQPTLYRKIKQHSELAAIEIIRRVRMSKAAELIMEKKYSIQEIAEMVGYSDTRTLRKHFAGQFGVSPSKYLESED